MDPAAKMREALAELASNDIAAAAEQKRPRLALLEQLGEGLIERRSNRLAVRAEVSDQRSVAGMPEPDASRSLLVVHHIYAARNRQPFDQGVSAHKAAQLHAPFRNGNEHAFCSSTDKPGHDAIDSGERIARKRFAAAGGKRHFVEHDPEGVVPSRAKPPAERQVRRPPAERMRHVLEQQASAPVVVQFASQQAERSRSKS